MTTSELVSDAIRRADAGWLAAHLDGRSCDEAILARLVAHHDPLLRHLGLTLLSDRAALSPAAARADLARLLPPQLPELPETALVAAQLYQRLWRYVPDRRPPWRTADLPTRVQVAWLRAEIATDPGRVASAPSRELLAQALDGLTADDVADVDAYVGVLVATGDPVAQVAASRIVAEALQAGSLAPGRAQRHVTSLVTGTAAHVAAAAWRMLAEPWAALTPLPEHLFRDPAAVAHLRDPLAADAMVTAAAHHRRREFLEAVAVDGDASPTLRRRAVELLGDVSERNDIPVRLAAAAADPLLWGQPTIAGLVALHRRGHFPGDADAADVVALALADRTIAVRDVATVVFTCRHAAFRALVAANPADPSWPRRLALLVALAEQGAADLPIGAALTDLLPDTPDPRPFLRALRTLRHAPADAAVTATLPREPEAALDALEAVGGPVAVATLRRDLGIGGGDPAPDRIAPHLRAVRHRALEVLWLLTDDSAERRDLLARLDPRDLPPRVAATLGVPDERELALLRATIDLDKPVPAMATLARHGSASTVPLVAELLRRVVAEVTAAPATDQEPTVPPEAMDAVRELGGRLFDQGRIRPVCLLDAADRREAGEAFAASVVLDLLDRADLADAERATLLEALLPVPHPSVRARVHPLLRHRDRHVRKHAIALVARDVDGSGAQALSASLIALTRARDVQTVRQALLALGAAKARWAAAAIASCLDHPTMNIKKTAAESLVHAGTPAAVPALLHWLGRHDNPGLAASLAAALRAILGAGCVATVLAGAERADDDRSRRLLLAALDDTLSAEAVASLVDQSPVGPTLLTLVAARKVRLAAGDVSDLTRQMAAHGLVVAAPPPTAVPEIAALVADGWDPTVALRLTDRYARDPDCVNPDALARLRPLFTAWLRLAEEVPDDRLAVLHLVSRLCPAPWSSDEIRAFGRAVPVLLAGLAEATGDCRDDLVALLEAGVTAVSTVDALAVAGQLRRLAPAAGRSPLPLLRRCGAVLTRDDVTQALSGAALSPDPWLATTRVLCEAFALPADAADETAEVAAWRDALDIAARSEDTLLAFRREDESALPSRARLQALVDVYPAAGRDVQALLLDWMTELQPIDAPPWTLTEERRERPAGRPRDGDLDQPRSAAQRNRLVAMLTAPDAARRQTAAVALWDWPEPDIQLLLLRAYLRGEITAVRVHDLAGTLHALDEGELRADHGASVGGTEGFRQRFAAAAWHLAPADLTAFAPVLLDWWQHGSPATRVQVRQVLRQTPVDVLAELLGDQLAAGAWGFVDLLAGRPLLRTPALAATDERLRSAGRDDLADQLSLVTGPLRTAAAVGDDATLAALREQPQPPAPDRPSWPELVRRARGSDVAEVRRALTLLGEAYEENARPAGSDDELASLLRDLLDHRDLRIRLQAHRLSRRATDRATHLRHTAVLLDDPRPAVVRSAVRALCHAGHEPAIPAVVRLLTHPHVVVRRAAADGLARFGSAAVPALRRAAGQARPDRRHHYEEILERIGTADEKTSPV